MQPACPPDPRPKVAERATPRWTAVPAPGGRRPGAPRAHLATCPGVWLTRSDRTSGPARRRARTRVPARGTRRARRRFRAGERGRERQRRARAAPAKPLCTSTGVWWARRGRSAHLRACHGSSARADSCARARDNLLPRRFRGSATFEAAPALAATALAPGRRDARARRSRAAPPWPASHVRGSLADGLWPPGRSHFAATARSDSQPAALSGRSRRAPPPRDAGPTRRAREAAKRTSSVVRDHLACAREPGGRAVTAGPLALLARLVGALGLARPRGAAQENRAREARCEMPLHGRRCVRWQRSLGAAPVPWQRYFRSRAGARKHRTRRRAGET
jgi:hypothetical protein